MILSDEQLLELRRRLKVTTVPEWKTLPGMESQITSMKALLSDVFLRKQNEALVWMNGIIGRVLLLGPGGCNKHILLDYCLKSLQKEYASHSPSRLCVGKDNCFRCLRSLRIYHHPFGRRLYWEWRWCFPYYRSSSYFTNNATCVSLNVMMCRQAI